MMKTFKKLVATAILAVSVVAGTIMVSATESGWVEAPASVAGLWASNSNNAKTVYSANKAIKGSNTYMKFDACSSLQSNFSTASRKFELYLMEYDDWSADETIRMYTGTVYWRCLTQIIVYDEYETGNIEGSSENDAELYIKYRVQKVQGDPTTPLIASGFFKYKVGAK